MSHNPTWPLLRTLGLYLGGCWVAVEFADWLVGRYALPGRVVDLTLIGLLSFTPTVALLAWCHGAPGRQHFRPVEKLAIPLNVLLSAGIVGLLLFGQPDETLAVERVTVTDPSGEQITRELVTPSLSPGVSVFFLTNRSGRDELDWLQYGVPIALAADLRQHPWVKVWTPYTGMESYGMFLLRKAGYDDGTGVPVALMRSIAEDGRMEYFVGGEVTAADGDGGFTVTVTLYETASSRPLRRVARDVGLDGSLFEAIDEVTVAMLDALDPPQPGEAPVDLPVADRLTASVDAFRAHTLAMNALTLDGDSQAALASWQSAVDADPAFAIAQVARGRAYLENGMMLDGGMALGAALRHDYKLVDEERFIAKALNYVFRGERDKELAIYETWAELAPHNPLPFAYLASAHLYGTNDSAAALAALERVYELDPREQWALIKIAYLYEIQDNIEAAVEYYTRYHEANPEDVKPLNSLGALYRREGDLARARGFFERAAIVANGLVDPTLNLADIAVREGRYEDAVAGLDEAQRIATTPRQRAAVEKARMEYFAHRGQEEEYLTRLPGLAETQAQYQTAINVMMNVWVPSVDHYVRARRIEDAVTMLRRFEQQMQPPLNALVDVGYLLVSLELSDADTAESHVQVVGELIDTLGLENMRWLKAWAHARIAAIRGETATAIELMERARAEFADSVGAVTEEQEEFDLNVRLAEYYLSDGRLGEARGQLDYVLARFPAHVPANLVMVRVLEAEGRMDEAAGHLATVNAALAPADADYPFLLAARDLGGRLEI